MSDECGVCEYPVYWHDKEWEHTVRAKHRGFHRTHGYRQPPEPEVTADEEAEAIASILRGATHG